MNFAPVFLAIAFLLPLGNTVNAKSYFFERVYDETLAQASFVIADLHSKEAIVIDPKRDVDTYLAIARNNDFKITKSFLSPPQEFISLAISVHFYGRISKKRL